MNRQGKIDAILSDDGDALLFGAKCLIRKQVFGWLLYLAFMLTAWQFFPDSLRIAGFVHEE